MFLEKLEIHGFKSFAKKTIIEFTAKEKSTTPGIAAIVGPNGSGKSNISDAVRWVLGEQSIKLLRGKRAEDVIFYGSGKKARLGFAEVSLYLNNEDKITNIDYDQIIIKRIVYRTGESEYYINNSKTRLSDIQLLLAQANFGQRTYSVIGQGMIDTILSSTPQERKNFFDEATGVKQHQIKRDQAIDKIKKTEENLIQASSLLKEISPRLRGLEKQVKKLEKREELEKKLREMQLSYYGNLWGKITINLGNLRSKKKTISEKHLSITKKMSELGCKMEKIEKEQNSNSENKYEKLQQEYFDAMNKKNDLAVALYGLRREIEILKSRENSPRSTVSAKDIEEATRNHLKFFDVFLSSETLEEFNLLKEEVKLLKEKIKSILKTEGKHSPDKEEKIKSIEKKIELLEKEISLAEKSAKEKQDIINSAHKAESRTTSSLLEIQKNYQILQKELNQTTNEKNIIDVEAARVETKKYDLEEEIKKEAKEDTIQKIMNYGQNSQISSEEENNWNAIARIKKDLEMIGGIDKSINDEYEETKKRHDFLFSQTDDLTGALESTKKALKHLDEIIDKEFNRSFEKIQKGFEEYFKFIFGGGKAQIAIHKQSELESLSQEMLEGLSEEEQKNLAKQFKIGIEITACPPGKKITSINMLSGGEKALTSIALICAIIKANPSPFVVLDEVDAALDEANSERFAQILSKLSEHTQFIAITHNRATMEKANTLYGITMNDEGMSKLLSIDLEKAMEEIKDKIA